MRVIIENRTDITDKNVDYEYMAAAIKLNLEYQSSYHYDYRDRLPFISFAKEYVERFPDNTISVNSLSTFIVDKYVEVPLVMKKAVKGEIPKSIKNDEEKNIWWIKILLTNMIAPIATAIIVYALTGKM